MQFIDKIYIIYFIIIIGFDSKARTINFEDKKIKVQINDINGAERYRSNAILAYRGVNGFILVYDITDEYSFKNIKNWLDNLDKNGNDQNKQCKILIGNKLDRDSYRQVKEEEGKKLANEYKMPFFETSSKNGENVEEIFIFLINKIYRMELNKNN